MKTFLMICCAVMVTGLVHSNQLYTDLANFCSSNGMDYLSLTTTGEQTLLQNRARKTYEAFQKHGLRVRRLSYDKLYPVLNFDLDTLILLTETKLLSEFNTSQLYLEDIQNHKIRKTVLVFVDYFDFDEESKLNDALNNLVTGNAWFTLMYQDYSNMTNYRNILSLSNNTKTLVQDIKLTERNQMVENHNLEGLELYSNTLSWAPYFMISDCDDAGQNCEMSGFLNDFMNAMGKIVNFTWTSHAPIDGSWGTVNENGVWTAGPMSSVMNGEYHMSISPWLWKFERFGLMDFVSLNPNTFVLALTPQPAELDMGLFIRPFQDEAWILFLASVTIILINIAIPYSLLSYYEHTESFKLSSLSSWLFFLLINAYYGGALTMFFSSELTLPFNSIEDVMRSYPDWNLKFIDGNDIHFIVKAKSGDYLYSEYWERVTNFREQYVFQNLEEGLNSMKNERAVIHIGEGRLTSYFKTNPFYQQKLKVFAKSRPIPQGIILQHNSPLKPILQAAANALTEAGIRDALLKDWEGVSIPQNAKIETMVLTTGQVILGFLFILALFGCSILILFCEINHKIVMDLRTARAVKI